MEQRTSEWYAARLGKVTASKVSDVIAKTKTGTSQKRESYKLTLIAERITGAKEEIYFTKEMERGVELEPRARELYEAETFSIVSEVGFIDHPTISGAGASPDGLVGEDGLIEIKCPKSTTHLNFVLTGEIKPEYLAQMMWQMACTGRQWCDFVSFDDRCKTAQLHIKRVHRNDELIKQMEDEVVRFLVEIDEAIDIIETKATIE